MGSPVAELGCLSPRRWDEALRRIIADPRERSRCWQMLIAAALSAVPSVTTVALRPPTLLLWNASASTPRGLYRVFPGGKIQRGDSVISSLREPFRSLAASRGYLPFGVPLVKRVAAVPGDRVCAGGGRVLIDGRLAVLRKTVDGQGRKLPAWSGCIDLDDGEYLLFGDSSSSFDGRYFGLTRNRQIIGRAVLLWHA